MCAAENGVAVCLPGVAWPGQYGDMGQSIFSV